jgi:hypothetical protein
MLFSLFFDNKNGRKIITDAIKNSLDSFDKNVYIKKEHNFIYLVWMTKELFEFLNNKYPIYDINDDEYSQWKNVINIPIQNTDFDDSILLIPKEVPNNMKIKNILKISCDKGPLPIWIKKDYIYDLCSRYCTSFRFLTGNDQNKIKIIDLNTNNRHLRYPYLKIVENINSVPNKKINNNRINNNKVDNNTKSEEIIVSRVLAKELRKTIKKEKQNNEIENTSKINKSKKLNKKQTE